MMRDDLEGLPVGATHEQTLDYVRELKRRILELEQRLKESESKNSIEKEFAS